MEDEDEGDNPMSHEHDISVLTQSPAVNTIAGGTTGGKVHLINLKYNTLLFMLEHVLASSKRIKSISSALFPNAKSSKGTQTSDMIGITSLTF